MKEKVHTVGHYYDGPRAGIADYEGRPHLYECQFSEELDEYTDAYRIMELDQALFELAMEDWKIFLKWKEAFENGVTDQSTHPALPEDRERHKEIQELLVPKLKIDPSESKLLKAKFTASKPGWSNYQVEWRSYGT